MNLILRRFYPAPSYTLGLLYLSPSPESFFCLTLEDTLRPEGVKIPGQTCIPAGHYPLRMTISQKFKGRRLPLIDAVPNFTGIRIHGGNTEKDTEGCILIGSGYSTLDPGFISHSAAALVRLMDALDHDPHGPSHSITVVNPVSPVA